MCWPLVWKYCGNLFGSGCHWHWIQQKSPRPLSFQLHVRSYCRMYPTAVPQSHPHHQASCIKMEVKAKRTASVRLGLVVASALPKLLVWDCWPGTAGYKLLSSMALQVNMSHWCHTIRNHPLCQSVSLIFALFSPCSSTNFYKIWKKFAL